MSRSGASGRRQQQQNGNGGPKTPLLPAGVNNKATMPQGGRGFRFQGEEVVTVQNVNGTDPGEILYNRLISPSMVRRLGVLASAFQRIKWHECKIRVVPLNGSTTTAGYTAGVIEDPELMVPSSRKETLAFLTALRATIVRQAWVEDKTGMQVPVADRPEMFTQTGSDVRRYSPGRFVMAAGGNIINGTFQVLLKYDVTLSVPMAIISSDSIETEMLAGTVFDGAASRVAVTLPQTNDAPVGIGETVTLSRDMMVSIRANPIADVRGPASRFSVLRQGSVGKFGFVTVGGIGDVLTFMLDIGQPDGAVYYPTRWNEPQAGAPFVVDIIVVENAPASVNVWVNP